LARITARNIRVNPLNPLNPRSACNGATRLRFARFGVKLRPSRKENLMSAVIATTPEILIEQQVVIHDVPWDVYEGLMCAQQNHSAPRFTYYNGELEIYMPSERHEKINRRFEILVSVLAEEFDLEIESYGSTTYRRKEAAQGVEPDCCFYIQSVEKIAGVQKLNLAVHPPPDLVVEVDVTSPSLDRFPIYADLRVPEIWRYSQEAVKIYALRDGKYHETETSLALPKVTGEVLTRFLAESQTLKRSAWLKSLRAWVRSSD
jgi:Uma2 family endonuclease